jgi:hypothetical protein
MTIFRSVEAYTRNTKIREELNISNLNNKLQDTGHNGYVTFYEWKIHIFRSKFEHTTQIEEETWGAHS